MSYGLFYNKTNFSFIELQNSIQLRRTMDESYEIPADESQMGPRLDIVSDE